MLSPQENNEEIKKIISEEVKKILPRYLQTQAFTARKLTDTPVDDLQVVPRSYVNLYGSTLAGSNPSTLGRPVNSVVGQQYFDTDLGKPIFKNNNNNWVDATGSVVGSG